MLLDPTHSSWWRAMQPTSWTKGYSGRGIRSPPHPRQLPTTSPRSSTCSHLYPPSSTLSFNLSPPSSTSPNLPQTLHSTPPFHPGEDSAGDESKLRLEGSGPELLRVRVREQGAPAGGLLPAGLLLGLRAHVSQDQPHHQHGLALHHNHGLALHQHHVNPIPVSPRNHGFLLVL